LKVNDTDKRLEEPQTQLFDSQPPDEIVGQLECIVDPHYLDKTM
jgi:hypothetical protein